MSLSVSRERVKERCRISDASEDGVIDRLIAEMVPAISAELRPEAVADPTIAPSLNLAALEMVCAEFLDLRLREPGASATVHLLDVEMGPDVLSPAQLRIQAEQRLAPYRVTQPGVEIALRTGVGG